MQILSARPSSADADGFQQMTAGRPLSAFTHDLKDRHKALMLTDANDFCCEGSVLSVSFKEPSPGMEIPNVSHEWSRAVHRGSKIPIFGGQTEVRCVGQSTRPGGRSASVLQGGYTLDPAVS